MRRTLGRLRILFALLATAIVPFGLAPIAADAVAVPTIVAIEVGYGHTCALTSAGGVLCWGYGLHGALGTGRAVSSVRPAGVVGLGSGVRAIAAGSNFSTCALLVDGAVRCWGWNRWGQLGDGTRTDSSIPVDVSSLTSGVTAIAVGGAHVCALTNVGGVKCWGNNGVGQLGDGTKTHRNTPVDVSGLASGVTAITAGVGYSCAILTSGNARCWGLNSNSQTVDGTLNKALTPAPVAGLTSRVTAIAAGDSHTCALTAAGGVVCWGFNRSGQIGDGTTTMRLTPVDVVGLTSGVAGISAGGSSTCALTKGGGVKCWGDNRFAGQLGDGTTTNRSLPVDVVGLSSGVSEISVSYSNGCARKAGGVKCWGFNAYGQLGNGTRTDSNVPVDVDFATHQAIVLGASEPAGTIGSGTAVTFTAIVSPLGPSGERARVRFEIYREENGVRRLAARRDVPADAAGRASLRWTFVTPGVRSVRARALETATFAASSWSSLVRYTVR